MSPQLEQKLAAELKEAGKNGWTIDIGNIMLEYNVSADEARTLISKYYHS